MKNYKSNIVSRVLSIVIALCMVLPVSAILSGNAAAEITEPVVEGNDEFWVYGTIYAEAMTPIDGAKVIARNMETGDMLSFTTTIDGYYEINIAEMPNGVSVGDLIVVEADDDSLLGEEDFVVETDISEKNIDIVIFGTSAISTLSSYNPTHYTPDVVALSLSASDDIPIEGGAGRVKTHILLRL